MQKHTLALTTSVMVLGVLILTMSQGQPSEAHTNSDNSRFLANTHDAQQPDQPSNGPQQQDQGPQEIPQQPPLDAPEVNQPPMPDNLTNMTAPEDRALVGSAGSTASQQESSQKRSSQQQVASQQGGPQQGGLQQNGPQQGGPQQPPQGPPTPFNSSNFTLVAPPNNGSMNGTAFNNTQPPVFGAFLNMSVPPPLPPRRVLAGSVASVAPVAPVAPSNNQQSQQGQQNQQQPPVAQNGTIQQNNLTNVSALKQVSSNNSLNVTVFAPLNNTMNNKTNGNIGQALDNGTMGQILANSTMGQPAANATMAQSPLQGANNSTKNTTVATQQPSSVSQPQAVANSQNSPSASSQGTSSSVSAGKTSTVTSGNSGSSNQGASTKKN